MECLIGKRPFANQTTYEKFTNTTVPPLKDEETETTPVNGTEAKQPEPAPEVKAETPQNKNLETKSLLVKTERLFSLLYFLPLFVLMAL